MHSQHLLIALEFCFVGDAALLDAAKKGNLTRVSVYTFFQYCKYLLDTLL